VFWARLAALVPSPSALPMSCIPIGNHALGFLTGPPGVPACFSWSAARGFWPWINCPAEVPAPASSSCTHARSHSAVCLSHRMASSGLVKTWGYHRTGRGRFPTFPRPKARNIEFARSLGTDSRLRRSSAADCKNGSTKGLDAPCSSGLRNYPTATHRRNGAGCCIAGKVRRERARRSVAAFATLYAERLSSPPCASVPQPTYLPRSCGTSAAPLLLGRHLAAEHMMNREALYPPSKLTGMEFCADHRDSLAQSMRR